MCVCVCVCVCVCERERERERENTLRIETQTAISLYFTVRSGWLWDILCFSPPFNIGLLGFEGSGFMCEI